MADEEKEKCFLTGVEVANLTHEALDDIFLNRRMEATEKLGKAEIIADNSECMSHELKDRIRTAVRALTMEIATGHV
jgi:hypothetical protein